MLFLCSRYIVAHFCLKICPTVKRSTIHIILTQQIHSRSLLSQNLSNSKEKYYTYYSFVGDTLHNGSLLSPNLSNSNEKYYAHYASNFDVCVRYIVAQFCLKIHPTLKRSTICTLSRFIVAHFCLKICPTVKRSTMHTILTQ